MIRRVLAAAILIPLVLASIFYLSSPIFLVLIDLVLGLALWEFFGLIRKHRAAGYWLTFAAALALPWVWCFRPEQVLGYLVLATLLLLTWSVLVARDMTTGFPSAAGNLLALLYLGVPMSIAGLLQAAEARELLLILITVWMTDTAAYFAGKFWGRHKITPAISPSKSLEGYLAGFIAATATVPVYCHFLLPSWSVAFALWTGFVLGVLGTIGDLFESVLKRGAGIKDSSSLIPGHGGVLDRIDSLLFAFPSYYLLRVSLLAS
ncbi:MAG: phosphatidate cytidylyltransferase [Acidobacteriota bacterium]